MPDWHKGQHGCVPTVLERLLADVQYSAHIPVVQQVGQFRLCAKMFFHTKSQLFVSCFVQRQEFRKQTTAYSPHAPRLFEVLYTCALLSP